VRALVDKLKGYEAQIDDYTKNIDSLKQELEVTRRTEKRAPQ
jgi:hypothetical protein